MALLGTGSLGGGMSAGTAASPVCGWVPLRFSHTGSWKRLEVGPGSLECGLVPWQDRRAPMGGDLASFDPNFVGTMDFRRVTRRRKWELC